MTHVVGRESTGKVPAWTQHHRCERKLSQDRSRGKLTRARAHGGTGITLQCNQVGSCAGTGAVNHATVELGHAHVEQPSEIPASKRGAYAKCN